MAQRKLVNQMALSVLASVLHVAISVLAGLTVSGCINPVEETYEKGVEGGGKAIQKSRDAQEQVDESANQIQEQEKQMEGSP